MTEWQRAWTAWIVTVLLLAVYGWTIRPLEDMAGGLVHLDVRFGVGYTHADVLEYFERLGPDGRSFYAKTTAFDTVWPLCIAYTGALWARLSFERRWVIAAVALCPVAFGLLDLIENIGLWTMLWQYPGVDPTLPRIFNVVTLVKQAMIPGWIAAMVGLPVLAIGRLWGRSRGVG